MEFLNVIAAALGAYAFSAVWYIAMSKPWIRTAGIPTDAAGKPQGNGSPIPFLIAFVAMVLVAGMMRHVFQMSGARYASAKGSWAASELAHSSSRPGWR